MAEGGRQRYGNQDCVVDVRFEDHFYIARPQTVDATGERHDIPDDEGLPVEFQDESSNTADGRARLFLSAKFGQVGGRPN